MRFSIAPFAKPRMTGRDKWKKPPRPCVARYRAFKDEVRYLLLPRLKIEDINGTTIIFRIPMPSSWGADRKKRYRGTPHKQRPDKDNLEKALLDAMSFEDCTVWDTRTIKLWDDEGSIEILWESEI